MRNARVITFAKFTPEVQILEENRGDQEAEGRSIWAIILKEALVKL
jgi:hypothetical protein